jgi:hypothetical protein
MRNLLLFALLLAACPSSVSDDDDSAGDDATPAPPTYCETLGLSEVAFNEDGPYGTLRHDLMEDFSVELHDGSTFDLSESWTGCDVTIVIPHTLPVSAQDPSTIWQSDVLELALGSAPNARYLFVTNSSQSSADVLGPEMQTRVDEALAAMDPEDRDWWSQRLHVAIPRAADLNNPVEDILGGVGSRGFAIDRTQHVRGVGSYADVNRYDAALSAADQWPWEANLANARYEVEAFNFQAARQDQLDLDEDVLHVTLWDGDVTEEFTDIEVTFPSAEVIATYDTLEIDIEQRCPNDNASEFGNCGAWDYLAHVFLQDPADDAWIEVARYITTYHREGRWILDATAALPLLADGGTRNVRYTHAPSWNTQPTKTYLSFRFANRNLGMRPTQVHPLFTGGGFGSAYNDGRDPIDVAIPATAQKVEVYAIITGHGAEASSCAEFCNHQHEFTVNGETTLQEWPDVGNQQGCAQSVSTGTVPNQGGTWWFGRGGWCPGRQVDPMRWDVTDHVDVGSTATVSYRGLFNDNTPPDGSGNIHLQSWLIIHE